MMKIIFSYFVLNNSINKFKSLLSNTHNHFLIGDLKKSIYEDGSESNYSMSVAPLGTVQSAPVLPLVFS